MSGAAADGDNDASSSSRTSGKSDFHQVLSRIMSNDKDFTRLVLDSDEVCSFIRNNMDSFLESMRVNTTVTSVKLHQRWSAITAFDGDYGDYERFCCVVARGIGALENLKKLEFECKFWDNAKGLSILLEHVSMITTLEITISDDGEPPECLDKAFGNLKLLEKLVVKFDYPEIYNPFPRLATAEAVTNLQSITMQGTARSTNNGRLEPQNTIKIHGSKNLREIVLKDFKFDGEHNVALAETIANSANLKSLVVEHCEFVSENSYILGQQLGNTTSLEIFSWSCAGDFQIYAGLSGVLQGNKNLNTFILHRMASSRCCSVTHASGLQFLLGGLKIWGKSLRVLNFFEYDWTEALAQCLGDYLVETRNLISLALTTLYPVFADETFHQFFEGVALNTTLKELYIDSCMTTLGLARGISTLKENKTLEKLEILNQRDKAEALVECMSKLMHTGIKTFCFHNGSKISLSVQQGRSVLESLQQNYTLSECPFCIGTGGSKQEKKDIMESVRIIYKLNRFGRQYLRDEKGSKEKAVTLLSKVNDDLDCTFFHLLENPTLCELERPEAIRRFNARGFVRRQRLSIVEKKLTQLMVPSNFAKLDETTKQDILNKFKLLEQAELQYDSILRTMEGEVGTILPPSKEN